jgi:outer membrane protein assembly factor BamB
MLRPSAIILTVILSAPFHGLQRVAADDWPQWLGPGRESVWHETGIVETFPETRLPVKWRAAVSYGYAGPAVADGKVFVVDYAVRDGQITNNPGGRDELEGDERVLAFDAHSGVLVWKHEYNCPYTISYGGGPRCTPTVDGNRVYTLGAEGNLLCIDTSSGNVLWQRDFKKDFGAETPYWGHAAHPLVDDERLYCLVGGDNGVVVCFDKHSGDEIWRSLPADEPGYCPPSIIEHAGQRQLVIWLPKSIHGLIPETGEENWMVPLEPAYGMSVTMPRQYGDLLFASGIGHVGALLRLVSKNNRPGAEIVWRGNAMNAVYSCNSAPVLYEGVVYGCDVSSGALVAARLSDGERLWETHEPTTGAGRASHGTAFIVRNADRFFLFSETGDLILARLSPDGYEELSRQHILEPKSVTFGRNVVWSHPAFAQQCIFARNDEELVCVDLADN